jgi:hypothetical protein
MKALGVLLALLAVAVGLIHTFAQPTPEPRVRSTYRGFLRE